MVVIPRGEKSRRGKTSVVDRRSAELLEVAKAQVFAGLQGFRSYFLNHTHSSGVLLCPDCVVVAEMLMLPEHFHTLFDRTIEGYYRQPLRALGEFLARTPRAVDNTDAWYGRRLSDALEPTAAGRGAKLRRGRLLEHRPAAGNRYGRCRHSSTPLCVHFRTCSLSVAVLRIQQAGGMK